MSITCPKPLLLSGKTCILPTNIQNWSAGCSSSEFSLMNPNRLPNNMFLSFPYQSTTPQVSFGTKFVNDMNTINSAPVRSTNDEKLKVVNQYNYATKYDTNFDCTISYVESKKYIDDYFKVLNCPSSFYNEITGLVFERKATPTDISSINQYLDTNRDCVASDSEIGFYFQGVVPDSSGNLVYYKSV